MSYEQEHRKGNAAFRPVSNFGTSRREKGECGMKNQMELIFDAVSQNEAFARVTAGAFFSQLNPTLEVMADVKTAVSEAVTNAIVHGYQNKPGKVRMECTIEGDTMTVVVEDNGIGIEDVDKARQPFYTTGPREERSGMGFAVMEAFSSNNPRTFIISESSSPISLPLSSPLAMIVLSFGNENGNSTFIKCSDI